MRAPVLEQLAGATELTLIRGVDGLESVRAGWELLARGSARAPMQDFAWSEACARMLAQHDRMLVAVVGALESPAAIAPLFVRGRRAELLGGGDVEEPSDVLYEDPAALDALAAALARTGVPLLLRRLPAGSPTVPALAAAFRPAGLVATRPGGSHATIVLDDGWTEPEGRLKSRRASDLRRARRRAEQSGEVSFEMLAPEPEQVDELLDAAFAIEERSWKGRCGTALARDARKAAFFRRYAAISAARGELRLSFMRIGGEPVAMQLAVEWDRRLWLLKIGYDEAASRCSPGMLLLLESTRWAAQRELRAVQLLGSIEPWTCMWTDVIEETVTVAAYPAGVRSLAAAAGDAALLARKRVQALRGSG